MSEDVTKENRFSEKVKRGFYVVLGTIALFLGALGLFLPVLPTTPLVILAAACYCRGSERLHAWLLRSRWFGGTIQNYQQGRGLTQNTKIKAIVLMWVAIVISAALYVASLPIRVLLVGIAFGVTIYLVRLPTLVET